MVVVDLLDGEANGKFRSECSEPGAMGATFLWNSLRSPGPPDVFGRSDISEVSTRPSAIVAGVAAFNLSRST